MTTLSRWQFRQERNTAMKVFSRLFVGIAPHKGDGVPLAFATPHEENAAGRKRQETVLNWLGGKRIPKIKDGKYVYVGHALQYEPDESVTRIVENVPREGFRITDDVKRVYWGGGNVVWRIADPDGWEVEIQSSNLMAIIQSTTIREGGLIEGKCVWGRAEGINVLLHETSEEYKDAIKAAETLKAPKQMAKSSRQVGGVYRLVDGTSACYLGKIHVTRLNYRDDGNLDSGNTELTFPPLPGAPTARLKAIGNYTIYNLEPSVPFEAVVPVDDDGKLGSYMLLYKKAPLVDHLSDTKIPEITNAYLDSFDWKFASSSISCVRITSVTVEPITDPVVKLLPWTDAQYEAALKHIRERNSFQNYGMYVGHWFKHAEHAVRLGDTLCGDIGQAGELVYGYGKRGHTLPYGQPLVIEGDSYTVFTATDDDRYVYSEHNTYTSSRAWWHSQNLRQMYRDPAKVQVIPIPNVDSQETYEAWFNAIRADRALFTIVARNKE